MSASGYVELEVEKILAETEKALLLLLYDDVSSVGTEVWVPKSQVAPEDVGQLRKGDEDVTVMVTEWFAEKEGLL